MNTLVEPTGQAIKDVEYRKYEVGLIGCNLETGALVTPETIVGFHHKTGLPVNAGFQGQVATIYYNPMHNSLMIMALSGNNQL